MFFFHLVLVDFQLRLKFKLKVPKKIEIVLFYFKDDNWSRAAARALNEINPKPYSKNKFLKLATKMYVNWISEKHKTIILTLIALVQ